MKIEKCGNITLINGDCMEFMQSQSDKSFDLAIVDPPYGIDYAAKPARSKHEKKIHPTQKPIILYKWLLQNFAEPGQRILNTHGGSMSHAIAAHKLGFDLTIIEKAPVYYEQAKKRLIEFQRQQVLF
jgi:site-specific DNA-methyltransferase (adenine-specific)